MGPSSPRSLRHLCAQHVAVFCYPQRARPDPINVRCCSHGSVSSLPQLLLPHCSPQCPVPPQRHPPGSGFPAPVLCSPPWELPEPLLPWEMALGGTLGLPWTGGATRDCVWAGSWGWGLLAAGDRELRGPSGPGREGGCRQTGSRAGGPSQVYYRDAHRKQWGRQRRRAKVKPDWGLAPLLPAGEKAPSELSVPALEGLTSLAALTVLTHMCAHACTAPGMDSTVCCCPQSGCSGPAFRAGGGIREVSSGQRCDGT